MTQPRFFRPPDSALAGVKVVWVGAAVAAHPEAKLWIEEVKAMGITVVISPPSKKGDE